MKRIKTTFFLMIFFAVFVLSFYLYSAEPAVVFSKQRTWWELKHITGDLWGKRSFLEENGLTFDLVYTGEEFWNTRGGITCRHAREYRGDISFFMELDTESMGLWDNGTFFIHLQNQHGNGITEKYVGDFQVLSNIDADDFTQVSEFWYRHAVIDNRLWIKLGKQEANKDFAGVEYGCEFINSSPGFSPSIPLVTYPDQDWGVVLGVKPVDLFSLNIGLYQGRPDGGRSVGATLDTLYGPMLMVEPAFHYRVAKRPGHFRVGGWFNGDRVDKYNKHDSNPGMFRESYGWYLTWDQEIWKENAKTGGDEQGLGLFGQFGWTPEDRSLVKYYAGGGIQWIGIIPVRNKDILGIGVFHVELSNKACFVKNSESAVEFFYKTHVSPSFNLKPDLQYIVNPGGTRNGDAVVIGIRAEVSF